MRRVIFLWFFLKWYFVSCDFTFPDIKLEAFEPKGFRVSIPEISDIRQFAFHGNLNKAISEIQPGEFSGEILNPATNGWSYFNPDLKLQLGDKIYYWAFMQQGTFGYRKPPQVWEVKDLLPWSSSDSCGDSQTEVLGPTKICRKQLLSNFTFSGNTLDEAQWKRAHFIPSYPDYEFCSYQRRDDTTYIKDGKLVIKPIPFKTNEDVRGTLDLRNGCTSHLETDCIMYQNGGFILPPVVSARMKTTKGFKYGTVEVRAKLPAGDWIYPEIYLQSSLGPNRPRIFVAYSRGNKQLMGNGGDDLGGSILFGGPVLNKTEPERSNYLRSTRSKTLFSTEYNTYSVVWEPTKISVLVNGVMYGETDSNVAALFTDPMDLVLGVGVGGVTDFPDDYMSANNKKKPWTNYERLQVKKFFSARDDWLPTWGNDSCSLQVEYVKIWAL